MDDPIFDPWGGDSDGDPGPGTGRSTSGPQPPSSAAGSRWRSPAARAASVPRLKSHDRLTGTAGFLRTMAAPRLADVAQRLEMARHTATVEDLLDGTPPTLRLLFRPWRGPWTAKLSATSGLLEIVLADGPEGDVTVRTWLDPEAPEPTEELRVSPSQLGAAWLERSVLQFVQARLGRV